MKPRLLVMLFVAVVLVGGRFLTVRLQSAGQLAPPNGTQAPLRPITAPRPETFIPGIPTVVNTPVAVTKAISIPGAPLASTDLLWVDQASERLYFADRSNFAVDIVDAENDVFLGRVSGFVGPTGPRGGGPNGVLVTPDNKLWVGDGNSLVQVVDLSLNPPRIVQSISTRGTNRADELAYDPVDRIIIIGNDRESPPYATLISADTFNVLGIVPFPEGSGLEQPVWNPQLHEFMINVPTSRGAEIALVDPTAMKVTGTYAVGSNCGGTGLALGPFQRLLVACGAPFIINSVNGSILNTITQVGSGDEVWYNSGDGRFYVTAADTTGATVLGVLDAENAVWRQNVPAPGARNVAALASNNHIFTVVRAPAANTTDTTLCAQFGIRGTGCVAVFTHQ
jgi:hypothetical protein